MLQAFTTPNPRRISEDAKIATLQASVENRAARRSFEPYTQSPWRIDFKNAARVTNREGYPRHMVVFALIDKNAESKGLDCQKLVVATNIPLVHLKK
jgi:hypothetical protein